MTPVHRIAVSFGEHIDPTVVRRIDYAFRVYCAVYGLEIAEAGQEFEGVQLCYGVPPQRSGDLPLAVGYVPRATDVPASPPRMVRLEGHDFPCFHPAGADSIDWLGEVFEWLSSADELAIRNRGFTDRIPYRCSLHGRYGLDLSVPYAALAMQGLNQRIRRLRGNDWPASPMPPSDLGGALALASTHDVDYLPISFPRTLQRFLKNLGITLLYNRDLRLAGSSLATGLRAIFGGPPLYDCFTTIVPREKKLGINSSCFFVCRRGHRRDPNYNIDHPRIRAHLKYLVDAGVEIGVHGSYSSLEDDGRLVEEYQRLASAGHVPVGGRQHWLRYHNARLFDELSQAGAWYDCTVGYSEKNGFRSGACFPYPPYNFAAESPFPLLELPMALMDAAIYHSSRHLETRRENAHRVLEAVRRYGWGGVSILWHDSIFHGGIFPQDVIDLYWELKAENEKWMSARELVELCWPRYAKAGLLPVDFPQGPCTT